MKKLFLFGAISLFLMSLLLAGCTTTGKAYGDLSGDVLETVAAYYPFDGNANDMSGNGNDGIGYGVILTEGKIGQGYEFFGSNSTINIGSSNFEMDQTGEFTIAMWMNIKGESSYYNQIIKKGKYFYPFGIQYYRDDRKEPYYSFLRTGVRTSNPLGMYLNSPRKNPYIYDNEWNHIALSLNNVGVRKVYINGVLVASNVLNGSLNIRADDTIIGNGIVGILDEVVIFNKALSDEEISTLYSATQNITCFEDIDCGLPITNQYCDNSSNACVSTVNHICNNPGTPQSYCISVGGGGCTFCPNGCEDGACVVEPGCYNDADCGQPTTEYYCDGNNSACTSVTTPICENPGTSEAMCSVIGGGGCGYCPYGCTDGACIPSCIDSDGGLDYYKRGNTTGPPYPNPNNEIVTLIDHCFTNTRLNEGGCGDTGYTGWYSYDCPNGCSDGACIPDTNTTTCTDSDGGSNLFEKGTTTGWYRYPLNDFDEWVTYEDSCNGPYVREWICQHAGSTPEGHTPYLVPGDYPCDNGCSDGACVPIINQTHKICSCISVEGPGTDECQTDAQCCGNQTN